MRLSLVKSCLLGALLLTNPQATVPGDTIQQDSLSLLRDSVVQMVSYQNSTLQDILAPSKYGFPVPTSVFCKHLNVEDNGAILSAVTCRTLDNRSVFILSKFYREVSIEGNLLEDGVLLADWNLNGIIDECSLPSYDNRRQVSNEFLNNKECTPFYYTLLRAFKDAVKPEQNKTKIIS